MLSRYSLWEIVKGQAKTVAGDDVGFRRQVSLGIFFVSPLVSPIIQWYLDLHLTEGIVSIIVSAASIFAGLLLNLLVVVYGLAPAPESSRNDNKTMADLKLVIEQTFYNISYAIVVCGTLVVFSLIALTNIPLVVAICAPIVHYLGVNLLLAIIQVLKRCHSLIEFKLTRRGTMRARDAQEAWPSREEHPVPKTPVPGPG